MKRKYVFTIFNNVKNVDKCTLKYHSYMYNGSPYAVLQMKFMHLTHKSKILYTVEPVHLDNFI